jgi:hypothetical protein
LAGNLGFRTFQKGKIAYVNAGLSRGWTVSSENRLTFRAGSAHFFDTPQFSIPNFSLTLPSFGRIINKLNDGRTSRLTLQFDS